MNFGSLAQLSQAAHLENFKGVAFSCSLAQQRGQVGSRHLSLHLDTDLQDRTQRKLSLNLPSIGTTVPSSLSVFLSILNHIGV